MQQPPRRSTSKESETALTKLQSLPIEQRACGFIVILMVFGAVFGGITTDVEIQGCMTSWDCVVMNPSEQKFQGIQKGAYAGLGAAIILSLPAVLKEFNLR